MNEWLQKISEDAFKDELKKLSSENIYEQKLDDLRAEIAKIQRQEDSEYAGLKEKFHPEFHRRNMSALGGFLGGAGAGALIGKKYNNPILGGILGGVTTPIISAIIANQISRSKNPDYRKSIDEHMDKYVPGIGWQVDPYSEIGI